MRVNIDADERYPTYSIRGDQFGLEVEATDEQVARWNSATEAFNAAQDEMGDLYEAAEQRRREQIEAAKVEQAAREKAEREERRRKAEKESRARRAAVERMLGTVYDASGNPVGEVTEGSMGLKVVPRVD